MYDARSEPAHLHGRRRRPSVAGRGRRADEAPRPDTQIRWLLSYTAQQASDLASWQRDTEHVEKSFDFGGMPARNGVTAALIVHAGGSGVHDVLAGTDARRSSFTTRHWNV